MKKYQELENKIAELQKEVERLKKEESKLPIDFDREVVLEILDNPNHHNLDCLINDAFRWTSTSQGESHWEEIYDNVRKLSDVDISQLQRWVIMSYRKQYGD